MTLLVGSVFHMTRKIVSEMTYNVSMGTLNPTIPYHTGQMTQPTVSSTEGQHLVGPPGKGPIPQGKVK